jgi:hypothetical protein
MASDNIHALSAELCFLHLLCSVLLILETSKIQIVSPVTVQFLGDGSLFILKTWGDARVGAGSPASVRMVRQLI